MLLFFVSNVRVTMRFPSKNPRVAFGLPYLLIELFYVGMPVVRMGVRTVTRLTKILGCIPNFLTHGAPVKALLSQRILLNLSGILRIRKPEARV